jgi:hypothetical protein
MKFKIGLFLGFFCFLSFAQDSDLFFVRKNIILKKNPLSEPHLPNSGDMIVTLKIRLISHGVKVKMDLIQRQIVFGGRGSFWKIQLVESILV